MIYTDTDSVQKTVWAKSWFDGAGRVIRSGSGQGATPTAYDTVASVYDSLGRLLKQSNPYAGDSSGNGTPAYWTSNSYDPLSRVTQVSLADGQTVQTSYAAPVVTVTDQVGRKRQSQMDGLGRVVSVIEQDPATGSLSWTTSYGYDTLDNLTSVNQGGQTRSFAYDALSRLSSQTTPESGTVSFTYTDAGQVLKRTDARQVETHYQYDTLNRLTKAWYTGAGGSDDPAGSRPALPASVAATSDITISYNNLSSSGAGNGLVSQVSDGSLSGYSGSESYSYDSLSRLQSKTRTMDTSNVYTTGYSYNAVNQLSELSYPSGIGRLVTASAWSSSQRSYSYDRWGNRTAMSDSVTGASQSLIVSLSAGQATNRISSVTNNGILTNYSDSVSSRPG